MQVSEKEKRKSRDNEEILKFISSSGVYKTPFTLIILLQFYFGVAVIILVNLWYWNHLYYFLTGNTFFPMKTVKQDWFVWLLLFLLPLNIYGNILLFGFSIILFAALIMRILNWANPPKEGFFTKGSKTWKYTHRRFWNAFFAIWIARALPFPWADIIAYRLLGIKIGKNVVSYEGYIDPVFVDIGDYTMTSLNICIFSHLIFHDKIYIKKVRVGKGCIVGPHSIITPGTIMEERAILGANSLTKIGQKLEGNLIHVGSPVSKHFPIQSVEESIAKVKSLEKDSKKQE